MGIDQWGTRGTRPPTFQPEVASIGNVHLPFQFRKINLRAYSETDQVTLSLKKTCIGLVVKSINSERKFQLPRGKSLDKLREHFVPLC